MIVRTLDWPDDYDAILDHIYAVHGPDDCDLLAASYGTTPGFDAADGVVIDGEAGEIAAHAMIVERQIQIGESILPTAEISLLGVMAAYQGRGYESLLLEALHARMTERGDVLGLSFGLPDVFEPWQYEYAVGLYLTSYESQIATGQAVRAERWDLDHSYERRTADRLGARNQTVEVRRFYVSDLPAVRALYAAESACGHYLIARSGATWAWQIDYLTRAGRHEPDDFLVAEIDGQLVAYARVVSQTPVNVFCDDAARFSVIEAGGTHPDAVDALLAEIGRTAQTVNADRIGLFVHPASALMQHALARGAVRRQFTGAGFVRLHDLPLALNLLAPTFETRCYHSRFVGRAYRLIVMTEDTQGEAHWGVGAEHDTIELEIPVTALTRLITGWYGIDQVAASFDERHTELLRALFPKRDPKIGLADLI